MPDQRERVWGLRVTLLSQAISSRILGILCGCRLWLSAVPVLKAEELPCPHTRARRVEGLGNSAPETPLSCRDSDQDLPHLGTSREPSVSPWSRVPPDIGPVPC